MRKGRLREQSEFCLVIWLIGNGSNEIGPSNSGIVLSITLLDSLSSRKGLISFEWHLISSLVKPRLHKDTFGRLAGGGLTFRYGYCFMNPSPVSFLTCLIEESNVHYLLRNFSFLLPPGGRTRASSIRKGWKDDGRCSFCTKSEEAKLRDFSSCQGKGYWRSICSNSQGLHK